MGPRSAQIAAQLRRWEASTIHHEPVHPHLAPDTKTFDSAYAMGRLMEELARPLLREMFADCRIVEHCDTTRDNRHQGKRMVWQGHEYILPDFEISTPGGFACYLDVKSKQYHSYYHERKELQQFVDKSVIDDYIRCSAVSGMPCLILVHLWPDAAMHAYGKGDAARIHTGVGHPVLTEDRLAALLRAYPVNDWYYLTTAKTFQAGRLGQNHGSAGYYIAVRDMHKASAAGLLPHRHVFTQFTQEE